MSEHLTSSINGSHVSPIIVKLAGMSNGQELPAWAGLAVGQLSRREREILPLLAMRWTDREIADALCISYRTVTTHVSNIFDKLGINSRREVVAFAKLVEDMNR